MLVKNYIPTPREETKANLFHKKGKIFKTAGL